MVMDAVWGPATTVAPLLTTKVNESAPFVFALGVYVKSPVAALVMVTAPFVGSVATSNV
jgi:hypothetical protein